jgi:uncharacterized membrane protein YjfL (UPF0719 family)
MLMQSNVANAFGMVVKMEALTETLVTTLIFVVLGLIFFTVAFLILSRVFHLHKEIEEDQNTALGIVIGSVMIGLAIIIAAAIQG